MKNVNASIITIGDELLIGQTIDTNSAWIAQELNKIGVWVKKRVAVGDVWDDIWNALDEEGKDSDIILITGGLGPTADDITKPLLCKYFGGKLVVNEDVLKHVNHLFEKVYRRPGPMLERNLKQAEVPDVCTVLHNARGTAPGMWFDQPAKDGAKKVFFSRVVNALKNNPGIIATSDYYFEHLIPKGWIYEDIGNYYGADAKGINWRENQYDLILIPGEKEGDRTDIDTVFPGQFFPGTFKNHCLTGPKGSGDNAYIYFQPPYSDNIVKGTIPLGPKRFSISGADPHPAITLSSLLMKFCDSLGIKYSDESKGSLITDEKINATTGFGNPVYTHYSPPLDSIIYWFNKKSVNLYGEALMETFAYEKNGYGSTDSGIVIVKKFWKEKGMDENEINIVDGSGLSPLNRVTTHVQVEILKYAKSKNWFPYFFNSLPEYNGMKIKSGTIRGVKGFCGYHKARNGKEYIFSFLVNNYNGSASAVVNKMYKVLDILK